MKFSSKAGNEKNAIRIRIATLVRITKVQQSEGNHYLCWLCENLAWSWLGVRNPGPLWSASTSLDFANCKGYWTTHGYANSRIANSRSGRLADWTTRGCHWRLCVLSFRSFGGVCETASCPVTLVNKSNHCQRQLVTHQ